MDVVLQLVTRRFDIGYYPLALQCLAAVRQKCIDEEFILKFNSWIRKLKSELKATPGSVFLGHLSHEGLGLITSLEDAAEGVDPAAAKTFLDDC